MPARAACGQDDAETLFVRLLRFLVSRGISHGADVL
jgi:hypothetical protein